MPLIVWIRGNCLVVVVVVVFVVTAWNSNHQLELRGSHPIILECAVSARAVSPHVRLAECPTGQYETSRGNAHRRELLRRRRSIHSQRNEELSPGPVMGADDLATHDLPGALGIIVLPLSRGVELRGGGGAPAARHDAKSSRVLAYELG